MYSRAVSCALLLFIACSPLTLRRAVGERQQLQRHITISKGTTWLTEPLTEDGYVDYSSAIDEINAVPQSKNAAADLIEIVGVPQYWESGQREKLKQALGLSELPEEGENLKTQYDFVRDVQRAGLPVPTREEQSEQWFLTSSRPWTQDEAPFVHSWIEANAQHLSKVDAILAKPGYFEPSIKARERNSSIAPMYCGIARSAISDLRRLLIARSYLRAGEGRFQEATEDILRIHRLARLGKKAEFNAQFLDAPDELFALEVGKTLISSTELDLDHATLHSFLTGLQRLEPVSPAQDRCRYRRFFHLASASVCALKSPKVFIGEVEFAQRIANSILADAVGDDLTTEPMFIPYCCKVTSDQVDWDYLLRKINERYDRAERIYAIPDTKKRLQSIEEFAREMKERKLNFVGRAQFRKARKQDPTNAKRRLTDDIEFVLNDMLCMEQFSTHDELFRLVKLDLLQIATATRLYETSNGELPKSYEAIAHFFDRVPLDPFSGRPYRWKFTSDGLELSSTSSDQQELPRAFRETKLKVPAKTD